MGRVGFHGGWFVVCDESAYWYDESIAEWRDGLSSEGFDLDDGSDRIPPLDNPFDPHVTALFESHAVFVLHQRLYATPWHARLWDPSGGWRDTLPPPTGVEPEVALPIAPQRILVVGRWGSAIYEAEP